MKTLLVVDGNSLLNRAFYGIGTMTTRDGLHTNAVYGMVSILSRTMENYAPDHCVMAFDRKEPTFRHRLYAEYKAGRSPMMPELKEQFPVAKEVASALGFQICEVPGFEADDILGSYAFQAEEEGDTRVFLLTGDRDSLQLISDRTTVLLETNKGAIPFDREVFFGEYGIQPEQFVDLKALMGDSSDNIPGVKGIGRKTAERLISEYGSLEELYEKMEGQTVGKSTLEKLRDGKESAFFSRKLATIAKDAPLEIPYRSLTKQADLSDREALRSLYLKLEFRKFAEKISEEGKQGGDTYQVSVPVKRVSVRELMELPPDEPCSAAADFHAGILWVRTSDAVLRCDDNPFGFFSGRTNIAVFDSKAFYTSLEERSQDTFSAAFDARIAAYVLDSGGGADSLERLSVRYLNQLLPEEREGSVEADLVFRLREILSRELEETGTMRLYREIELPLAEVLHRMEVRGFQVDTEGIRSFGEELGKRCEEYLERIYLMAGHPFNVNSPKQLAEVLFDEMMLPAESKKRSTSADVLEKFRSYVPLVAEILDYRQVMKLKSTYTDALAELADANGRVHTSFRQTVTATGRLSSTEPNLQNIPVRTELGRELRRFFVAKDGDHVLIDADYSQIELRLLAAISGDETMTEAFRHGSDIHSETASRVFHCRREEVTPEQRKRAKAVNFGIVYGIGEFSLSEDLGIPRWQARKYIEDYMQTYPGVAEYLRRTIAAAKEQGYVTTLFGRRRYIPELSSSKKPVVAFGERVAMNSPIQGTAADIIKLAMVRLEKRLTESGLDAALILQVHDELIVECSKDCEKAVSDILRETMEQAVSLTVPLTVDVKAARNWYEGH